MLEQLENLLNSPCLLVCLIDCLFVGLFVCSSVCFTPFKMLCWNFDSTFRKKKLQQV